MKKALKICSLVLTVFLAVIVVFNVTALIKRKITGRPCETVLGIGTAVVISGSMEPNISINDMIVIAATGNYKVGDVITYAGNTRPVTHRVIECGTDEKGKYYITKGDANNVDDGKIYHSRVIGEVIFTVPGAGKVSAFLSQPAGFLLITLIAGAIIIVPEFFSKEKDQEKEQEKEKK